MGSESNRKHIILGHTVKRLRDRLGWTQEQLAKESGLGRSWISQIEIGNIENPSAQMLAKLAIALGVDPRDFWRQMGYPVPKRMSDIDELTPEAVEGALIIQSMPPEVRRAFVRTMPRLVQIAEEIAKHYLEPARPLERDGNLESGNHQRPVAAAI